MVGTILILSVHSLFNGKGLPEDSPLFLISALSFAI
jgi:hypothetical protein